MRKEVISSKFAANLSWIPNMKSLTLADNDLKTFGEVYSVLKCFLSNGAMIKSLSIIDNPICQVSASILRNYIIAVMSLPPSLSAGTISTTLTSFNEMDITPSDRETACQLFRTLITISNSRKSKSQQQSLDQIALTLCPSTIDQSTQSTPLSISVPSISSATDALISSTQTLTLTPSSLPLSSESNTPEMFRNFSRSGSLGLISDPLSPTVTGGGKPSSGFPTVVTTAKQQPSGDQSRRNDLEYRYPYKSFIPTGADRGSQPNQNVYAMALGNTALLTSPTLVTDMIQVVLTRRKIEEKFAQVKGISYFNDDGIRC
jgi:hypothetical protein